MRDKGMDDEWRRGDAEMVRASEWERPKKRDLA